MGDERKVMHTAAAIWRGEDRVVAAAAAAADEEQEDDDDDGRGGEGDKEG